MNTRWILGSAALLQMLSMPVAHAQPPSSVQAEVDFLLGSVESSSCAFHRNSTWHDSKSAVAHLRDKYNYLVARDLIGSTEDFVERAATKSSLSGQPYEVKCDGETMTSSQWLHAKLAQFRASGSSLTKPRRAPRE